MKMLVLSSLTLLLGLSGTALAHDSSHYVCTGFVGQGSGKYGFAMQFDEGRGAYGASRDETLSTVWAGALYQGVRHNDREGFGQNGQVTMADKTRANRIFYRGKYEMVRNAAGDGYDLKIDGLLNLSPTDAATQSVPVSTTLSCVDLTT